MKLLSLFSGIGAFEKGILNNSIPLEIVGYSEIDKFAKQSYNLLYDTKNALDLGDITKINIDILPEVEMITYGFPCQPFSIAGLKEGFDDYLNRGLMFFEALRIIKYLNPPICIAENVKNLKSFHKEFSSMINELKKLGYYNQILTINSKDYGAPQNRERIFIISTKKEINNIILNKSNIKLQDILLPFDKFNVKDFINKEKFNTLNINKNEAILEDFYANRPIRIYTDYAPALRATRSGLKVYQNGKIRFLTPLEGFRLMGFDDDDYYKLEKNISKTQLWKQLGNSIDVNITAKLIKEILIKSDLNE